METFRPPLDKTTGGDREGSLGQKLDWNCPKEAKAEPEQKGA